MIEYFMKQGLWFKIWGIFSVLCVIAFIVGVAMDVGQPLIKEKATIVGIGSCHGGDSFFSDVYSCQVRLSNHQYGTVYHNVMVGQPVYRKCYTDGTHCDTWKTEGSF